MARVRYIKCLQCFPPKKWRYRILKSLFFCLLVLTVSQSTIWILTFLIKNETSKIRLDCYFQKQVFQKYIKCLHCFSPKKVALQDLKIIICLFVGNDCFLVHSVGLVREHPLMMSWNFADQLKPYLNQRGILCSSHYCQPPPPPGFQNLSKPLTKVPKNNVETLLCVILNIQQNFNFLFLSFPGAQR